MGRNLGALLAVFVAGAAACSASPGPSATPAPETTSPAPTVPASTQPPSPTATPAVKPSPYPAAALPVRGKLAKHGAFLSLAPAPDGSLYVVIPDESGAVLALLDRTGVPAPGWPVTLPNTTYCGFLAAAADGSVRAICDATDIKQPDWCCNTFRAFALNPEGRPLPGWPREIDAIAAARVVGDDLVVLSDLPVTDAVAIGSVRSRVRLSRIGPDGAIAPGVEVPMVHRGAHERWAIGPDGVAYGSSTVVEDVDEPDQVLAIDSSGRVDGWPVTLPGDGSPPALDADGRVLLLVGSKRDGPADEEGATASVVAIDPADPAAPPASGAPLIGLGFGVDCYVSPLGHPPLSRGGVIVARHGMSFYALDGSLRLLPGWPYEASSSLQDWAYPTTGDEEGGLDCSVYAVPVLGPDGTLYAPLAAESESTGGSLVAIQRNGKAVPGWPVALQRAGSGFWTVDVGLDGTVFAAAMEREKNGLSATILGIAADSMVLWRTTVLEP